MKARNRIVFVFQTSTGTPGYETRDQNASRVFRYSPARHNNGWHNSIDYPASGDNPLNGNMYLPLYFDNGQAIHGANNVPAAPTQQGLRPAAGGEPGHGSSTGSACATPPSRSGTRTAST